MRLVHPLNIINMLISSAGLYNIYACAFVLVVIIDVHFYEKEFHSYATTWKACCSFL